MSVKFQMDGAGNIRVGIEDHFGPPASYQGIAALGHEGHMYIAVSEYHSGLMSPERVYEIVEVPTEGKELPDQNFFEMAYDEHLKTTNPIARMKVDKGPDNG